LYKRPSLFDAVDNVSKLLPVITAVVSTLQVNSDKMQAALGEELLATDLADYLVKKGMPFRSAHHVVGKVVQIASNDSIPISQISLETLCELSDLFAEDVDNVFDFQAAVARRQASGGTAPDAVKEQIKMAKMLIDGHKQ